MTLSIQPVHVRTAAFCVMFVALFIAPPVLLHDVDWVHRKYALMLLVFPIAILVLAFAAPQLFPASPGRTDRARRFFASRSVGNFVLIAGCGPLLLTIPTLNGWMGSMGLGLVPEIFVPVGEALVPAIRNIRLENAGLFADDRIFRAQAVHAYAYFAFGVLIVPALVKLCLNPKMSFISRNRDGTMRHRFLQSTFGCILTIPLFILIAAYSYLGWGTSDCTGLDDFMVNTNCALGDDLLIFVNANGIAFFLYLALFAVVSSVWNIKEAVLKEAPISK